MQAIYRKFEGEFDKCEMILGECDEFHLDFSLINTIKLYANFVSVALNIQKIYNFGLDFSELKDNMEAGLVMDWE